MWEWVNGVRIPQNRMRGITGSPNAIGGIAALGLLLIALFWRDFGRYARLICLVAVFVFLAFDRLQPEPKPDRGGAGASWFSIICSGRAAARSS